MTRGPVDVEAIVVAYLEAALAGVTTSTELPGALAPPLITLGRVGSTFVDRHTGRLERVRLDLDVRGEDQAASFDLAQSAVAALLDLNDVPFDHAAGVITGAELELGALRSPDPETDAERYLVTAAVFAHRP
jgi:hypothetical protein